MNYDERCKAALKAIEEIPELKALLNYMNRLPEHTEPSSSEYGQILIVAEHFMALRTRHQQELAALSAEALEDVKEWGAYASDYFKEKWHFDMCMAKWEQRAQNTARQDNKAVAASSGAAVSSPSSGALSNTPGPDGAVPVAWHVEGCTGRCIACEIEQLVLDEFGNQGKDYLLSKVNPVALRSQSGRGE